MSILEAFDSFHGDKAVPEVLDGFAKSVRTYMNAAPNQHTGTDFLRASHMSGLCPREWVLNYWNPKPNRSFDGLSLLKMRMGTDYHFFMQNYVLGPMGVLYGKWMKRITDKELVGDGTGMHIHEGFHPDPELAIDEMNRQLEPTWVYVEETLWSEKYRIKGHCDGTVSKDRLEAFAGMSKLVKESLITACKRLHEVPAGTMALCELKSGSTYGFEKLTDDKSIPEYYKIQANIYMWLKGVDRSLFLFTERDQFKMKGIVYPFEPRWINDVKRKAKAVWESIRDERLPETAMACLSPADKRAKSCVHGLQCWNSKLDFKAWIKQCKEKQPDRKWLDLSGVTFD